MKRKHLIILILSYVIGLPLVLLVGSLLFIKHATAPTNPGTITIAPTKSFPPPPTYAPVNPSEVHKVFSLVSTSPKGDATNVSPNIPSITLTFDKPVTVADIPFSLLPDLPRKVTAQGNSIVIAPLEPLQVGTTYYISIRLYTADQKINVVSYKFTVAGPTPTPLAVTPGDVGNNYPTVQAQQRNQDTDVYVANYTPHSESTFSVTSDYVTTPTGHFAFTVTGSKNDFINWLKSLQLTDQQIQSLDITYK